MSIAIVGFVIVCFGIVAAWMARVFRYGSKQDVVRFESLYDHERLEQLINKAGGDSIAQLVRLYKMRARQLERARRENQSHYKIRSLVRDCILLSQEINRLTPIEADNESHLSFLIQ